MLNSIIEVDVQGLASNGNEEIYKCCICGDIFKGSGNNSRPYKNEGRCCNDCYSLSSVELQQTGRLLFF